MKNPLTYLFGCRGDSSGRPSLGEAVVWVVAFCVFCLVGCGFESHDNQQPKDDQIEEHNDRDVDSSSRIEIQFSSPQAATGKIVHKPKQVNPKPVKPTATAQPIDRTKPFVGENGVRYFPNQFLKDSSLLVLAFEPDIRADYVIMTSRTILTAQQSAAAKKLAISYDAQFQNLIRERASILENARDGKDIDTQVFKVQIKLADLLRQIRSRINVEIMTQAQRDESARYFKQWLEEKAKEAQRAEEKLITKKKAEVNAVESGLDGK